MSLCITDKFEMLIEYYISSISGDMVNYTQLLDMDNSKHDFRTEIGLEHLI